MTEAEKQALLSALEYLWIYGADQHPAPARALNRLCVAFGLPQKDYCFGASPVPLNGADGSHAASPEAKQK